MTSPVRAAKLVIGDLEFQDLDLEFTCTSDLSTNPNQGEFIVYNLKETSRSHLLTFGSAIPVEMHAGYTEDPKSTIPLGLIFKGVLREISHQLIGPDWVTKVSSGDGDGKNTTVNFSLGPGASLTDAINKILKELQIGIGNAKAVATGLSPIKGIITGQGLSVYGGAGQELERLLRRANKNYSIQNGVVQILDNGKPTNDSAVVINEDSGLIGSPEATLLKNVAGDATLAGVKFRSLLNTDLYPGRQVYISSIQIQGYYRIQKVTNHGQSAGAEWYTDCEAVILK
jgi:hypothetical protein